MAAALPDPPDDWTVSTATKTHLALYYPAAGRSLVIRPTEPPANDEWTVKGLAGYGPEYPVFADGVDREEAVSEAWTVMETVAAGETATPIRTESNAGFGGAADDDERSGNTDTNNGDSPADDDQNPAADQADLTTFASDDGR